jgi:RHS repeat-associated protein
MKQRLLNLSVAGLALFAVCRPIHVNAATVTWVGGSGDWETATNWSTGQLPGPSDDVVIGSGPSITVTHSYGADTVNSITSQQAFQLSGGSLYVVGNTEMNGAFSISAGGTISAGSLDLVGAWINGGTIIQTNSSPNLSVNSLLLSSDGTNDGTMMVSGATVSLVGATVINNGTIAAAASCALAGGTIRGGTITLSNGVSMILNGNLYLDGVTFNGIIDVGNTVSGFGLQLTNGFTLNGTMLLGNPTNSNSGFLNIWGTQTLGGNGTVVFGDNPNCNAVIFEYANTTLTIGSGITVRGQNGWIGYDSAEQSCFFRSPRNVSVINQGTIACDTPTGTICVFGYPLLNDGLAQAVNGGALSVQGDWINNGTINASNSSLSLTDDGTNNGAMMVSGSTLSLVGATVINNGTIAAAASCALAGGTIRGGTITLSNGVSMILNGDLYLDGVTFNGIIDVGNTVSGFGLQLTNGFTLNGTMLLGNPTNSNSGFLNIWGTQTLGGNGTVVFGDNPNCNAVIFEYANTTLTIGSGITVRGQNGWIGYDTAEGSCRFASPQNVSVINQGTIACDVNGGTITLDAQRLLNQGLVQGTNGGTLSLAGAWINGGTIIQTNSFLNLSVASLTLSGNGTNNGNIFIGGANVEAGGTLVNNGTIAAGSSCALGGATSFTYGGAGTIDGGTISISNGASLILNAHQTLDGVTIYGVIDVGSTVQGAGLWVTNGLVLNGTLLLGNPTNGQPGFLDFFGSQTLGGNGTVILGNAACDALIVAGQSPTLTIGGGITIRGLGGQLGYRPQNCGLGGGNPDASIVNQGSISAAANGVTITIDAQPLYLNDEATLSGNVGSLIQVIGSVLGNTRNADQYAPQGTIEFQSGSYFLEAMSQDRGDTANGYVKNFAYGTILLDTGAQLALVDNFTNSAGPPPECVYANSLIVSPGATLSLNGLHIYARLSQISGTVTGGAVSIAPMGGGALAVNTSTGGSVSNVGASDGWTFLGRAGEHVTVTVDTGSSNVVPPVIGYAFVQLFDPSMNLLALASNTAPQQVVALLNTPLPVDGTYTVNVSAPANQPGAAGNYLVTVWDINSNSQPLVVNQQELGQIETPYSGGQWNFTGVSGEQIQFDLINESSSGVTFSLYGPNGWVGFSNLTASSDLISLPYSGAYSLDAFGTGGAYGITYSFEVVQDAETNLMAGESFTGSFVGNGQGQILAINVTNSGPLLITLNNSGASNVTALYVQFASPPTQGNFGWQSANPNSPNQQILIPSAIAGTYYVLVYGNFIATPGAYTVEVQSADVFLLAATPNMGPAGANVTLTLTGGGFLPSTAVALISTNGSSFPASSVSVDSFTQITATFVSNALPAGIYSIVVNSPSGGSATLTNAFQATSAGAPNFTSSLAVPPIVAEASPATAYTSYANTGSAPMPAPLLVLTATQAGGETGILGLDSSLLAQAVWTTAQQPIGFGSAAQFLAFGRMPGTLQPGESLSEPVYWAAFNGPLINGAAVNWSLGVIYATNTDPINWPYLQSSMQPPGIASDAWNAIFMALTNELGPTWGDYVTAFDNNAAYLGQLGLNIQDVAKLLPFETMQADGLCPIQILASAVDASVIAPGLPLTFSRSFGERISQRYAVGPFGRGWSHNWQRSLQVGGDGTITVSGPGGSQRIFQQDKRGGYFSQAGDYGTLAPDGSGGFELIEKTGVLSDYATNGTLNYVQDLNGNRITCGYSEGLLTSLTHSSGQYINLAYNRSGLIQTITDQLGHQTILTYDPQNQHLIGAQYFDGRSATYSYNTNGSATQLHAMSASATSCCNWRYFTYDSLGRLSSTHLTDNAEALTLTYPIAGQVTVTDALTNSTQFFYDHRGLLCKIVDALSNSVVRAYDNSYNLLSITDPAGHSYRYNYDNSGNLIQSTDPLGAVSQFSYTAAYNRLASVTDANGNVTQYGYDPHGNLQSTTYANNSAESWTYDAFGNPQTYLNRRNHLTIYTNNANGQLTAKQFADGSLTTYSYDPNGNLTNHTTYDTNQNVLIPVSMTYDGSNHLAQIDYPGGKFLAFTYDSAGRRTSSVDQLGHTLYYYYDAAGRLQSMTNELNEFLVLYQYDPAGRIATKMLGNGMFTTYQYNLAGQVLALTNFLSDSTVLSFFAYSYDSRGRRTSMNSSDGVWTYSYDDIGQLIHAVFASETTNMPSQDLAYVYDSLGNRTQTIENGITAGYTANNLNQYVSAGQTNYMFDADGNIIREVSPQETSTYTYSDENRLVSITSPQGVWAFNYDGIGNRLVESGDGIMTSYFVDPDGLGDVVAQYDAAGDIVAHFDYGLGLLSRTDGSGDSTYYTFDANRNARQLISLGGSIRNAYEYGPFGVPSWKTEGIANPFQFVGESGVQTELSGLVLMRARDYSPAMGRFLSIDPARLPGGVNLYSYSRNRPTDRIDPLGLQSFNESIYESQVKLAQFLTHGTCLAFGVSADALDEFVTVPAYVAEVAPTIILGVEVLPLISAALLGVDIFDVFESFADYYVANQVALDEANYWRPPARPPGYVVPAYTKCCNSLEPVECPFDCPALIRIYSHAFESADPNGLYGPSGFMTANYVVESSLFNYEIFFENETNATAPAQIVQISDPLSTNLNWQTFQLTEIAFGNTFIAIPPSVQYFQTNMPFSYAGVNFQVQINAGINLANGQVFANFFSVDPATGLPPSADVGFLPPEDGTGRGMGHVSYLVRPQPNLPTGLQIPNVAYIQFDENPVIATDQVNDDDPSEGISTNKQAIVTIDNSNPYSSVASLPAVSTNANFTVCWSGTNAGPAIVAYDIYVSTNDGPWNVWLAETTNTCETFSGQNDQSYAFYSVAHDGAGRVQTNSGVAQAFTTVIAGPPTLTIALIGNQVVLAWPTNAGNYILQTTTNLVSPVNWNAVTNSPSASGSSGAITLPITNTSQFFRLQSQ